MLAKDMHQILQIEFENFIFFSFLGGVPPQTSPFFQWPKVYNSSNKGIKSRKVGGIDIKIANILLKMNNGFQQNVGKRYASNLKLSLKIAFFSVSEGGT